MCTAEVAAITNAATRRCLSATRRHRAAPPSASSIHILPARKCPRMIGGIAASTEAYGSLGRVLRSAETILVSGQCEFSRIDLRLATRQQIREHTPRPARHGPAERAVPGVEMKVGVAC